jgi:HNH endonuclease
MTSWNNITEAVQTRAGHRCEYCGMHQSLQGATFHVEHIIPKSRGGPSDLMNLALACVSCNLHKSDRTEAPDSTSGDVVPLFNPRQDVWSDHFAWHEFQVEGKSATGRATVDALQLNCERRIFVRQAESTFDLFPP